MGQRRRSPLLDVHRELGARVTEFAGWEMPLHYAGVVSEHHAVRGSVGVFDVSHLGKLRVRGSEGGRALQLAVTADVDSLEEGRATYALVLQDDGGTIDDVFVYRLGRDEWLVVPNAANTEAVAAAIASGGSAPADEWDKWAIMAIQGPESFDLFEDVFPGTGAPGLELHRFIELDVLGARGVVARTGYTGERGFELYAPAEVAERAYRRLLEAGGAPVGLGARDTLRLEMGYALYGHELTTDINPLEARLGWAIAWDADFRGKAALERVRERGPARTLFGVRCRDRGVPRQGYRVLRDGDEVATVTSGNFSPTLSTGIALALGSRERAPSNGEEVEVEARARTIAGDIVTPPFVPRGRRAPSDKSTKRQSGG